MKPHEIVSDCHGGNPLYKGSAFATNKSNILFIEGDDIGIYNMAAYHRGLMVGETPNTERIANEGALFQTYYSEQSCTVGRTAFVTGMHPLRAGMLMPQLPGATGSLLPGTPVSHAAAIKAQPKPGIHKAMGVHL